MKKDGPINWDSLTYDIGLDSLLNNEKMGKKDDDISNIQVNKDNKYSSNLNTGYRNFNNLSDLIASAYSGNNPNFLATKNKVISGIKSENQLSKTFRTVSPLEDTTTDYNVKKYHEMSKRNINHKVYPHSGYYGESRLTR